jgi:D-sedoheptulose 7-phosphate isomerase
MENTSIKTPVEWMNNLGQVLQKTRAKISGKEVPLLDAYAHLESVFKSTRAQDASVWWVGNGGSAAMCAHLSQDMLNKLKMRSLVLADAPLLTCMANDFGYPNIYRRPLETLARKGDLIIAISSSGKSENILKCAELAKEKGMGLVSLSAFDLNNPLWSFSSDVAFYLDSNLYGVVEVGHEAVLHAAIETLWLKER